MDDPMDDQLESQDLTLTPATFTPPSISHPALLAGESYTHHSPVPAHLLSTPCVLGIDEAGRGPVLGPMVYGLYYLSTTLQHSLLAETHHFDDSKVLTPAVRADLFQKICTPGTDLYEQSGWAVRVMSARDIGAAMLSANGGGNLNTQAMDATIQLIRDVLEKGVMVKEVFIDTIGPPATYQKKLEKLFPTLEITVAKKADSLYPCVSAASVCAKVTRDIALEVLYDPYSTSISSVPGWGSGYPSDVRCTDWMKGALDPVFGWGSECRFSWGTVKEMLEVKGKAKEAVKVDWPEDEDEGGNMRLTSFMRNEEEEPRDELGNWFGCRVGTEVF
nr:hypothetical protein B0A51_16689 [Rachicladosporium sp. CCFEE 5018]